MQEPLSVSQVNDYLKGLVDADPVLANIYVRGEISNFKQYSVGGQWYFTLKDGEAQLSCVVFQSFAGRMKFVPKDGDSVIVKGKLTIFNKRGTYNLQVFWLEPEGLGALAKAFEQLKNKLEKAGLFDPAHKKPLPPFPKKIVILAAPEGAAVHDIINVAKRRSRSIELFVLPTIVQGADSVQSIVHNLELVQKLDFDVIILARGGGSLEDLWSFNEEPVARAIYASKIPVVSAVGHEIDFTIADFVADLRAATPSVAAELVVPEQKSYLEQLQNIQEFLVSGAERIFTDQYQSLDYLQERMQENFQRQRERARQTWQNLTDRLEALNPLSVLRRGFAVIEKEKQIIRSVKGLKKSDIIKLTLADGSADAEILGKKKNG